MRRLRARQGARRKGINESTSPMSTINITPFTDVLLVLLIIFMIAGSSLNELTGLTLDGELVADGVPEVEPASSEVLRVEVLDGGQLTGTHRDRPLTWELLEQVGPLDLEVIVSSRPDVQSGAVIEAYDRLTTFGFTKVSLGPPLSTSDESEGEQTSAQTP